jgi:hypothetical protein
MGRGRSGEHRNQATRRTEEKKKIENGEGDEITGVR